MFIVPILTNFSPLANASSTSYIDVSPLNEDGSVKGSPLITAVPTSGQDVEKVTFLAKAINEPDENYYSYTPDYHAPYSWSWPTGDPWVPDGEYTLKMIIHYLLGEEEVITRDITVRNYQEPNSPKAPTNVQAVERTYSSLKLAWSPSSSTRVYDYVIYQNGIPVTATTSTSITLEDFEPGIIYNFRVKTRDIYNNLSLEDNTIGVILPSEGELEDPLPTISTIEAAGSRGVTPGSDGFSGDVTLSVTAMDNEAVSHVDFYVKVLGAPEADYWKFPTTRKTGDTYSVNWSTAYTPEGYAIIKAVAYDQRGQSVTITNTFLVDNENDGGPHLPIWEPTDTPPANRIVAYLAGWSTYGTYNILRDLDASRITHLNYAFALINTDLKVTMGDVVQDPKNFADLRKLKEIYPHLKTIIAIGGWSGSANFIEAAATEEAREIFAESAVDFMIQHGFDGVDLDWEYPVTGGGPGTYPNPADRDNYPLLLETLRNKLDEQGEKDNKHYLLTIAGGATAGFANNTQLGLSQQYLDYVQIMTYDIHGPWELLADFNAPLFDDGGKTYSVDRGVQAYLDAGVPRDKLVMGVPFYGYRYNVTSGEDNGLRKPFLGSGSITYNRLIRDDLISNGYQFFWNEGSKVPYLYHPEEQIFISYDDQISMRYKAEYIRDQQLGGAMIWEISQDHGNDLLASLYEVLKDPYPDTIAPFTTATVTASTELSTGAMLGSVSISLTAEDGESGVEKSEFRINNGDWTLYSEPFQLEGTGKFIVDYRSHDYAGNEEAYSTFEIELISVTFANLYKLLHDATMHHGQRTALIAHILQAEKVASAEKYTMKHEKALDFVNNISANHIDEPTRQDVLVFLQQLKN